MRDYWIVRIDIKTPNAEHARYAAARSLEIAMERHDADVKVTKEIVGERDG